MISLLLAVMFLTSPEEVQDTAELERIARDADRGSQTAKAGPAEEKAKEAHITANTTDFDRFEGVALFSGQVVFTYDKNYSIASDDLYVFMRGSNELARVVAIGNVAITNETRTGFCDHAVYFRQQGEVDLYGTTNQQARLVDSGDHASEVHGSRIRFWLDAEQVEVENSQIQVEEQKGKGGLL